jgi:hypothetical protein
VIVADVLLVKQADTKHKYSLMRGLFEESKFARHAYEDGHTSCWREHCLQKMHMKMATHPVGENIACRKCMFLAEHALSSQLEHLPTWISIVTATSVDYV